MTTGRIVVFAYSDLGHQCLRYLIERKENIVCVYTHKDNLAEKIWFPSVATLAETHGIPVRREEFFTAESMESFLALRPEILFSFYYRNMIPPSVFSAPALGAYNMHGSLLPKYRGRSPVNWAVVNGETKTGATLHVITEKPDAGDIIDQEAVPIGPDDTAADVQARVTQASVLVLSRQLENLKNGTAARLPQDSSSATYFGGRRPENGQIIWTRAAQDVHNLVRGVTHPYPGAFADVLGQKTFIWRSRLPKDLAGRKWPRHPGALQVLDERLLVVCGDGNTLEIERIQRDGEEEISAKEFVKRHLAVSKENNV